ncbi:MFS transporter [Actinomadura madurae]|nr:MFS transporter [Actinomadura madurae]URN02798.1 MFS transporter [Actinomadura madurae]
MKDFLKTEPLAFTVAGTVLVLGFVVRALNARNPLIDLRLLKRRSVAAASGTMVLFMIAFMGAMLLLPLYYQTVRGEGALQSGLLLAPQGLGAMVTMPIGGKLTDRIGPGRVVLVGMVVVVLSVSGFAAILEADTSYWALGGALFVMGLGMGMTMMPTMAAAIQTLVHDEVPRASTMLNIIQQVSSSIGTAMISVLLANRLASELGGGAGGEIGSTEKVPPAIMEKIAGPMADAFQHTYWYSAGLLLLAFLPALLLPRKKPETTGVDAPVPMH